MEISEVSLDPWVLRQLMEMSADWEAEGSCWGYGKNEYEDLSGNRIFLAEESGGIIGYLFGHQRRAEKSNSILQEGVEYFEVEEIYVKPAHRSQGVGSALFRYVEECVRPEADYVLLCAAAKNFRAVLHFYIDELGMEFWSARLFKKL